MIQKIPDPDGGERQQARGRGRSKSGPERPVVGEDVVVEPNAADDPEGQQHGASEGADLGDRGLPPTGERELDPDLDPQPEPTTSDEGHASHVAASADELEREVTPADDDSAPQPDPAAPPPQLRDTARPLELRIEAVLFGSGQALSPVRLAKVLDEPFELVKTAVEGLAQRWSESDSALELVEIAGGWRFMTRPEYQPDLAGLARKAKQERLSPAALETLAVVAYRQPIGRADIEAVRGVAAGPLLRVLLDRDLIRITGRSPEPGHPLLYGTTRRFLDHFGLRSLKSLPDIKDLLAVS